MRNTRRFRLIVVTALGIIAAPLGAQTSGGVAVGVVGARPDSAQIAAVMANSMRMLKPAVFVLDHKTELALSPEQVQFLEFLIGAERDSADVRQARMMAMLQDKMAKRPRPPVPMSTWSGPIDEQQIRDEACQNSQAQAESIVGMMRDRRAVGAVLTPAQVAQLTTLEQQDMMNAMRPKPRQP
jgi:Spy/CpxP family protein refolding chaperone